MIGLGRMGANMVRRLMADGHECVVHDVSPEPIDELAGAGAVPAHSLEELVAHLAAPRHIWVMIPAAFVGGTVERLAPLLDAGDTIIDGGNSWYRHDIDRSGPLRDDHGVHYLDVGTSGGTHGLERGYCLMIGGDREPVRRLAPVFTSLAPGVDAAERTPGRSGDPSPSEQGWYHCGPSGAGHFVKMVHNGIEYGMMAAYAEGLNVLARANIGAADHADDAETAPLEDARVLPVRHRPRRGQRGVAPRLGHHELAARPDRRGVPRRSPARRVRRVRERLRARAAGPCRRRSKRACRRRCCRRRCTNGFSSRGRSDIADKVLSAMRAGFGGHHERRASSR